MNAVSCGVLMGCSLVNVQLRALALPLDDAGYEEPHSTSGIRPGCESALPSVKHRAVAWLCIAAQAIAGAAGLACLHRSVTAYAVSDRLIAGLHCTGIALQCS
jgi:hypothetical protein